MRYRYDMQLHLLDTQLTHMGELCETAIAKVTQALNDGSTEQAQVVIKEDEEIDQIEKDIERLCLKLLLQQQPVARDLREVSAALKMISDMERIGDQASDIADLSKFIEENHVQIPELIGKMAEMTVGMVTESVDAFVKRDLDLCRKVIDDDDQVDDAFNRIKEELAELMYQNLDAKAGLDLLMTAKYMERIGDHATNIAEWVEFSITGVHKDSSVMHQEGERNI